MLLVFFRYDMCIYNLFSSFLYNLQDIICWCFTYCKKKSPVRVISDKYILLVLYTLPLHFLYFIF